MQKAITTLGTGREKAFKELLQARRTKLREYKDIQDASHNSVIGRRGSFQIKCT